MQTTLHSSDSSARIAADIARLGPCVAFDIDGVCLDFAAHFATCHRLANPGWCGVHPETNPEEYGFGVDAAHVSACVDAAHHSDLSLVHDDLPDVLHTLTSRLGVACVAVTAYPYAEPRTQNLLKRRLDFALVVTGAKSKRPFYTLPNVLAVVDDWLDDGLLTDVARQAVVCVPGHWRYTQKRFGGDKRVSVLYNHPREIVAEVEKALARLPAPPIV